MEMPEGWKRLKKAADLLDAKHIIWISRGDKASILDLMKEMAEALDAIAYDLTDKKIPETEGTDLCMVALRKFEIWK